MGKVKQKLAEDMMLHPESHSKDDSNYMTDAELKKQIEEKTWCTGCGEVKPVCYCDEHLSTCCSATRWLETDICSECKEHTDFKTGEQDEDN